MTQSITIKNGETFSQAFLAPLPTGTWSVASDIRKSNDSKVADLTAAIEALLAPDTAGNTHAILLSATSSETALWPVGTHRCDIRFADASLVPVVKTSETFAVVVDKAITHD